MLLFDSPARIIGFLNFIGVASAVALPVPLYYIFRRRIGEAVLLTVALVLIYIFSNSGVATDTRSGTSANLTRLGNAYEARGDSAGAVEAYAEAIRMNPLNEEAVRSLKKLRGKGRIK